jgi:hypothetical protein
MLDLLYSHPQGHFERHAGEAVVLTTSGQVQLIDDQRAEAYAYLEWSGAEEMFTSLLSGDEVKDVETVAQGHGRLEVYAGERLIAEDAGFSLRKPTLFGGVSLLDASGKERVVLRDGDWWLPGERVGDLTIRSFVGGIELPDMAKPGTRSRVSNLAERLLV